MANDNASLTLPAFQELINTVGKHANNLFSPQQPTSWEQKYEELLVAYNELKLENAELKLQLSKQSIQLGNANIDDQTKPISPPACSQSAPDDSQHFMNMLVDPVNFEASSLFIDPSSGRPVDQEDIGMLMSTILDGPIPRGTHQGLEYEPILDPIEHTFELPPDPMGSQTDSGYRSGSDTMAGNQTGQPSTPPKYASSSSSPNASPGHAVSAPSGQPSRGYSPFRIPYIEPIENAYPRPHLALRAYLDPRLPNSPLDKKEKETVLYVLSSEA